MNDSRQRLQAKAVFRGVLFRHLPAAFVIPVHEALGRPR
jgi:hypothetical protein